MAALRNFFGTSGGGNGQQQQKDSGRTTPTPTRTSNSNVDAEETTPEAAKTVQSQQAAVPVADLKIDIPGQVGVGGVRQGGQDGGTPSTPSKEGLPSKKKMVRRDSLGALKSQAAPKLSNRASFHSRDSFMLSQLNANSGQPSPYVNPSHYSNTGDYHRRSIGSTPSGFTMSSTGSNATIRDHEGALPGMPVHGHTQHSSASSEMDLGHHRGPTAFGLGEMRSVSAGTTTTQAGPHMSRSAAEHPHAAGAGHHHGAIPTDRSWNTMEEVRLGEDDRKEKYWRRWGPYVSERQWATVREDYSSNGDAWSHFPHEHARSRTYRWGEDGLAGICDNHCRLAFTLGLWNGKDRMLKERMFGLANNQGNHGEDVKELYWYLDNLPTHSYQKMLYKYPQGPFPYEQLVRESQNRSRDVAEFEVTDTDLFDENRYWDIFIEYAKDAEEENATSIRISAFNRGPEPADLHIIPQMFFRNYWSWPKETPEKPEMKLAEEYTIQADHDTLGRYFLYCSTSPAPSKPSRRRNQPPELISDEEVAPQMLFTENETNFERLYGGKNVNTYAKDAFHDHIIPAHRLEKDRPQPVRKTRTVKKLVTKVVQKKVIKAAGSNAAEPKLGRNGTIRGKPATNGKVNGNGETKRAQDGEHGLAANEDDDDEYVNEEVQEEVELEEEYYEMPTNTAPPRNYVNPEMKGTKSGAHYFFQDVPANGGCAVVRLKLTPRTVSEDPTINDDEQFDATVESRRADADEFYGRIASGPISDDMKGIMRQALAGMLWCKQFYNFVQPEWLNGDPGQPPPPPERKNVRNKEWRHLHMEDILSMPDKWEYPFPAVWDTAFHCIPLAMIDPAFAKKQLDLFTREWYMKPDGALPAYEWNFSDVNPPVHAWSTFRVFKIERKMYGREDLDFLERVFQKLLINFTWWVNRKDSSGSNVFEGGFLGLDNIGPFNRSEPLPTGGTLRQADGTAWMAFYALNMLNMALELAKHNPTYEDIASKFFEHFIFISDAMTYKEGGDEEGLSLWSEQDGFYYDAIQWGPGHSQVIPVKSLVGLIPLYATLTIEPSALKRFPSFAKRMQWFLDNRPEMSQRNIANMSVRGRGDRRLLAMVSRERLETILKKMLDETEFLSSFGVRSLSKYHKDHPFKVNVGGEDFDVGYWPGDSHSPMFGGNSNWRGPVWYAVNFLLVESLQRFYQYYGEDFKIECPTGSGDYMHLGHVAEELQHRLISIFCRDDQGRRATNGGVAMLDYDPHFRELVHFYEFFHGDTGKGLGASHQTGWTGLVAYSILSAGMSFKLPRTPRTPRSTAAHYFDEHLTDADSKSDTGTSQYSYSATFSRPPSPDEL
ncbi:hypothetical protein K437DRAFT_266731 [Tilletiaria anomala UBC 951]|uniref:Uncharacterized protein n=1 Tax=Tilletiaria anomala (strain ATCC 24038 / CBS 436.72 / UBC 951) TaxID=1037660 RepID=A0A066WIL8_TILAU|nr:uncharacterized protein K437DRAFT_266731 [Tilletiaria anomala UBC 951]KDN52373.1 hypothetical protein K437DRAFT_266731 [Tilletiaria anomala UBC 951]